VAAEKISPENILEYLRYGSLSQQTPIKLELSPFVDRFMLSCLLDYCEKSLIKDCNGLPLLLDHTDTLLNFDAGNQLYYTEFFGLVPSKPDCFASCCYPNAMQNPDNFKEFKYSDLEVFLSHELPNQYKNNDALINLDL
jgi:hypothetical protein